ncbi:MAG: hypothetical protein HC774_06385 [Sphingomonadales bacterium]|nr:hypothetical protein [Sphingomonadales bacterium]
MPCGGPPLNKTDIETIRRWIIGGRPNTEGDPHIRTVDGKRFDFQAAGEFTLLRGEDMELQARQTPVPTAAPLTDPNTGLAACVSVNSAIALRAGRNRLTYQPDLAKRGEGDRGLILRIDGKPVDLAGAPVDLSSGGRVLRTSATGGVEVQMPGGTSVVITPARWGAHNIDFMNVEVRHARAVEGVMGAVAAGGWLPALEDGAQLGARPADANARYAVLYGKFANSWRVRPGASLFDYEMGLGPRQFDVKGWPSPRNGACIAPPTPVLPAGGKPPSPIAGDAAKNFARPSRIPIAARVASPTSRRPAIVLSQRFTFGRNRLSCDHRLRRRGRYFPLITRCFPPARFDFPGGRRSRRMLGSRHGTASGQVPNFTISADARPPAAQTASARNLRRD